MALSATHGWSALPLPRFLTPVIIICKYEDEGSNMKNSMGEVKIHSDRPVF